MKTSEKGIALIKEFEGLRLEAYKCQADVWTIGYGHTREVKPGDSITEETAERMLVDDVRVFELAVERALTIPVTQYQFDALVSLAFNIGANAFAGSTLVKKLNAGDMKGAADEFLRWNKAGGRVLNGLTRRREAERALFLAE